MIHKIVKINLKKEVIMSKTPQIKLPEQLWNNQSIDLTRHSYQGKLLSKSEGFKLGKTQRKKVPLEQLSKLSESS